MSVDLTPNELGFRRPFDKEVTETLKLTNGNPAPVAFKVKTTAPKQYCVRPNSGVIQPNGSVEVQVLLQAMKEEPPLDYKCRDKFLVQSTILETEPTAEEGLSALWSNIEKTSKGSIQEKKIRVSFLSPAADTPNGVSHESEEKPPSYTANSPSPQFNSPAPAEKSSAAETARSAAEATGVAGAAAAVSNAIPSNQEDLKAQLSAAQKQIAKLTQDLKDPQVRQRKVADAQEKVQTVVQQSQDGGVPLHIVAALCLVSFIIAYLFF